MLSLDKITLTTANIEFKQYNKILFSFMFVSMLRGLFDNFSVIWGQFPVFLDLKVLTKQCVLLKDTAQWLTWVSFPKQIYLKCSTFKN